MNGKQKNPELLEENNNYEAKPPAIYTNHFFL